MTQEEYFNTDWHRGNWVRLTNGKEYQVRSVKKRLLLLFTEEYQKYFTANWEIIVCRTSDEVLDDDVAKPKANTEMQNATEQEAPEKRKRKRICKVTTVAEKVEY